jgi:hypothetical protein
MKTLTLLTVAALTLGAHTATAQSHGSSVHIKSGQVCADNKCMRFSSDLKSVSIYPRRAVSVSAYNLRSNPKLSVANFRDIFALALRQGTNSPSR